MSIVSGLCTQCISKDSSSANGLQITLCVFGVLVRSRDSSTASGISIVLWVDLVCNGEVRTVIVPVIC